MSLFKPLKKYLISNPNYEEILDKFKVRKDYNEKQRYKNWTILNIS